MKFFPILCRWVCVCAACVSTILWSSTGDTNRRWWNFNFKLTKLICFRPYKIFTHNRYSYRLLSKYWNSNKYAQFYVCFVGNFMFQKFHSFTNFVFSNRFWHFNTSSDDAANSKSVSHFPYIHAQSNICGMAEHFYLCGFWLVVQSLYGKRSISFDGFDRDIHMRLYIFTLVER